MEYPENEAAARWNNLSVVHVETTLGNHYCGYCRLPRLVAEPGYRGLLNYVPVHGGITYAEESETGQMVYGFDCAHAGDEQNLWWRDREAVLDEARRMEIGIWVASLFEPFYLLTTSNKVRSRVIGAYHWTMRKLFGIDFDLRDNFGAMLMLLGGQL